MLWSNDESHKIHNKVTNSENRLSNCVRNRSWTTHTCFVFSTTIHVGIQSGNSESEWNLLFRLVILGFTDDCPNSESLNHQIRYLKIPLHDCQEFSVLYTKHQTTIVPTVFYVLNFCFFVFGSSIALDNLTWNSVKILFKCSHRCRNSSSFSATTNNTRGRKKNTNIIINSVTNIPDRYIQWSNI